MISSLPESKNILTESLENHRISALMKILTHQIIIQKNKFCQLLSQPLLHLAWPKKKTQLFLTDQRDAPLVFPKTFCKSYNTSILTLSKRTRIPNRLKISKLRWIFKKVLPDSIIKADIQTIVVFQKQRKKSLKMRKNKKKNC